MSSDLTVSSGISSDTSPSTKSHAELARENAELRNELKRLRDSFGNLVAQAEVEEEYITNKLMKRLDRLKSEKEKLAVEVDREEEFLTNNLQKKLSQLQREKHDVQMQLDQEQEYLVNKLRREMSSIVDEKKELERRVEAERKEMQQKLDVASNEKQQMEIRLRREEQHVEKTLKVRMERVLQEKVEMENQLEQEQEYIVNKLQARLDDLSEQKKGLEIKLSSAQDAVFNELFEALRHMEETTTPSQKSVFDQVRDAIKRLQDHRKDIRDQNSHLAQNRGYLEAELKRLRNENFTLARRLEEEKKRADDLAYRTSQLQLDLDVDSERIFNETSRSRSNSCLSVDHSRAASFSDLAHTPSGHARRNSAFRRSLAPNYGANVTDVTSSGSLSNIPIPGSSTGNQTLPRSAEASPHAVLRCHSRDTTMAMNSPLPSPHGSTTSASHPSFSSAHLHVGLLGEHRRTGSHHFRAASAGSNILQLHGSYPALESSNTPDLITSRSNDVGGSGGLFLNVAALGNGRHVASQSSRGRERSYSSGGPAPTIGSVMSPFASSSNLRSGLATSLGQGARTTNSASRYSPSARRSSIATCGSGPTRVRSFTQSASQSASESPSVALQLDLDASDTHAHFARTLADDVDKDKRVEQNTNYISRSHSGAYGSFGPHISHDDDTVSLSGRSLSSASALSAATERAIEDNGVELLKYQANVQGGAPTTFSSASSLSSSSVASRYPRSMSYSGGLTNLPISTSTSGQSSPAPASRSTPS